LLDINEAIIKNNFFDLINWMLYWKGWDFSYYVYHKQWIKLYKNWRCLL